jgi:hypothetical protein
VWDQELDADGHNVVHETAEEWKPPPQKKKKKAASSAPKKPRVQVI